MCLIIFFYNVYKSTPLQHMLFIKGHHFLSCVSYATNSTLTRACQTHKRQAIKIDASQLSLPQSFQFIHFSLLLLDTGKDPDLQKTRERTRVRCNSAASTAVSTHAWVNHATKRFHDQIHLRLLFMTFVTRLLIPGLPPFCVQY